MASSKLILIDGNSLVYRAFFALPLMQSTRGEHTNAVYGFTGMLLKLIEEQKPTHLAVAFDYPAPTFRHRIYEEYKGTRQKTPSELKEQTQRVKQLLAAFQIPIFEVEGYEADDLIGTLTVDAKPLSTEVIVVSGDADLLQLIEQGATVYLTRKGITQMDCYDAQSVKERYGVEVSQIIDYKALTGDPSDNIPGVPGIGAKTASRLLQAYGSLENIYEADLTGKLKANLERYRDQLFMGRGLVTLRCDVPLDISWEQCRFTGPDYPQLMALFSELEFRSLAERVKKLFPGPERMDTVCDPLREALPLDDLGQLTALLDRIPADGRLGVLACFPITSHRQQKMPSAMAISVNNHRGYFLQGELLSKCFPAVLEEIGRASVRGVAIVSHDIKPLYHLFCREGFTCPRFAFDTRLAAYLLEPDQGNLDFPQLLDRQLGIEAEKPPEGGIGIGFFWARQAAYLLSLTDHLKEQLELYSLQELYYELELPLVETLYRMENRGIRIDLAMLKTLAANIRERIQHLQTQIYQLAGEEFNLNSPQQLSRVLYEKLQLPVLKKTKTGYSTAAGVLEELAVHHPIVPAILIYRQLIKLEGTYLVGLMELVDPADHKIYTTFNQTVTTTGRLSSSEPNLQNIPVRLEEGRKIRRAFIPSHEDKLFISADYSQIELRVLAHLSADPILVEAFRQNEDIHRRTAAEVFHLPAAEVTSVMRNKAKAVNFGIIYGISDYGLALQLGVTRQEAQKYIDGYFARYRGVKAYFEQSINEARELGFVSTLLNRRRYLPEINSTHFSRRSFAERTARNTPVQGSAADIIKLAMLGIDRLINAGEFKARLLLQVHDELLFECDASEATFLVSIIKQGMEQALTLSVPLTVDLKWGLNWADLKPLEGEEWI